VGAVTSDRTDLGPDLLGARKDPCGVELPGAAAAIAAATTLMIAEGPTAVPTGVAQVMGIAGARPVVGPGVTTISTVAPGEPAAHRQSAAAEAT
jgi:hypothetical protein